jgi:hypothetical protein
MAPFRWRWRSCGRRGRADRRARALECGWRGRPTRCCESGRRAHRADAGAVRDVRDAWARRAWAREQSGRLRSSHRALVDARGCAPQKNGDLRIQSRWSAGWGGQLILRQALEDEVSDFLRPRPPSGRGDARAAVDRNGFEPAYGHDDQRADRVRASTAERAGTGDAAAKGPKPGPAAVGQDRALTGDTNGSTGLDWGWA